MLVQLNFKISRNLLALLDEYIDEIGFRSRGQIINIALAEWFAQKAIVPPINISELLENYLMKKINHQDAPQSTKTDRSISRHGPKERKK